ncbi:YiiD C-terminal domain-containing protein [Bdellovibrio sp. HCB2-146]|uniref:YiiD C-terminal domain-containing protein n=1 Tax=Bdellovibrio sp. HCB2-146 TaxID=3394362 RepID=UPI0039BCCD6B
MKQEILNTLETKIALFKHLGIHFVEMSSAKIHIKADLEKNLNHKGTAFGGSLYTAAVLSAYALVLTGLRTRKIATENIVIAKGSIDYLRPVEDDFEVICQFSTPEEENQFYADLLQKGRARKLLIAQIRSSGGSLRATFSGDFVVRL